MLIEMSRGARITAILLAIGFTAAPFYLVPIGVDWAGSAFAAWFHQLSSHGQRIVEAIGRMAPFAVVPAMGFIAAIGIGLRARRSKTASVADGMTKTADARYAP